MCAKPRVPCWLCLALLMAALLCTSCGSKAEETPGAGSLLSLLAGIPEDPIDRTDCFIYFVDYSAMESAYNAARPADAEEFADLEASDEAHKVWSVLFRGTTWVYSRYWQVGLGTGPETVGFSPLEVDQAVWFGVPPSDCLMLAGSFDADAIRTAYQTSIGLAPKDFDGTTVWCAAEDGADGFQMDLSKGVPENPFGGDLGRRQPMIISEDLLMSSADLGLVLAHLDAAGGTVPNLADALSYRAAVNAVGEDADILQATIACPIMAMQMASTLLGADRLLRELSGSTLEGLLEDYQELPAFELLILADSVTSDEQIARVGLLYRDAESAEIAAPILLDRLATYPSLSGSSFAEVLTPANGTGPRYYVQQESERAVLVLEFPAPRATPEEIVAMLGDDKATATSPGWVYRRLSQMLVQRDTSWLSTATRAELEAGSLGH
jgi:hypothetical protein